MVGSLASEMIVGRHNGDDDAIARLHFLDVRNALLITGHGLGVGFVARRQNDDREVFVDQSIRTVLHLAGGGSFSINVGDFLELQSAFWGDWVVDAPAQIEEFGLAKKYPLQ